jgi:hypothetical protein
MATRFNRIGAEFQVNQAPGQDNSQTDVDVAALSDGRFLVVFEDTGDIGGQFVNANGTLSGASLVAPNVPGPIADFGSDPAVAQRTGGAAVVVWSNSGATELAVINSAGVNTTSGGKLIVQSADIANTHLIPDVATLSDGRSLIVWTQNLSSNTNVLARILNAAGTGFTTPDFLDVDSGANSQTSPAVAASANAALVVYVDATQGNFDVEARFFNGSAFESSFVLANHSGSLGRPNVTGLADGRFVVVYTADSFTTLFGRIYDPATPGGAFLSDEFQIAQAEGGLLDDPSVIGTLDGGFAVSWFESAGGNFDIHARRFDAHGLAFGDDFIVNTLTDGRQEGPGLATSGANVLFAWEDEGTVGRADTAPSGIRAQAFTATAFDYDSARHGDFGPNGRSDILFQNDTGDIALWQTSSAGTLSAISSLGPLVPGFRIDGTGNFNGTAGADILLRSTNSVAVLPMNGTTPQPVQVLGGVPTEFLNSGIGDFTGDGQSDLLFRHINSGEIATWGISNNALSTAPRVLGSTSSQFHIVAVDDFTGDQQADILFRHDNGDIAIWRVANNGLAGAPSLVGSTSTTFHVVATGDFDGNNANDILFRNDNGDLAMWLLNSSGALLAAPAALGNAGLQFHVEGSGDLNGDRRSDIIFRDAHGTLIEWLMNGTSLAAPPSVIGTAAVDYAIAAHHFELI